MEVDAAHMRAAHLIANYNATEQSDPKFGDLLDRLIQLPGKARHVSLGTAARTVVNATRQHFKSVLLCAAPFALAASPVICVRTRARS